MGLNTKQKEFLQVLEKTLGVVTVALDKTGISREEYDEWMENIFFKKRYDEVQHKSIDYVENQLMREINKGNLQAITFYLKTKGKNRGY